MEFNCRANSTWSKSGRAKETAFALRTGNSETGDKNGNRSWISSLGPEGGTMMRTTTMISNCRTPGIITRSTQGYRKEKVKNIFPQRRGRRRGQDRVWFKLLCFCPEATGVFGRTPAWRPIPVSGRCRGAVRVPMKAVKGA